MTHRFSSRELSFLRNNIPINRVIETLLSVATGNKNGALSFNCPVCHSANTSINTKHNLARCFDCRQNFNPIEFVMHQRHTGFVDSVKWLKRHGLKPVVEKTSIVKKSNNHPTSIGQILPGMLSSLQQNATAAHANTSLTKRVSDIEHRLEKLDLLVKELRSLIYQK
ncbi:hypothetical protein D1AOALGA4SA_1026 [Olavius algarvensis Delta 1 endosymbiont]|nr:hypothetical protein D1AOALGA4SA_1026 [Olavius algarvensis Delta 1 endosymbiont]